MPTPIEPPQEPHLDALLAEAGWVRKLAKRLARDQAASEDIAQSTLALALERRPTAGDGLRPWLAKVAARLARHSVRSEVRRQGREARAASYRETGSLAGDEVLERFELQQTLAKRVGALPEPYRGVLIRRYYHGLSVKQIAKAVGASPGVVRSQLARGLERLRRQYDGEFHDGGALGVFLVVAGSGANFLSRRIAEITLMQTSTKVAAAAAAILVASVAFLAVQFQRPDSNEAGSAGTLAVVDAIAHDASDVAPDLQAPADEGDRRVAARAAVVAEPKAPTLAEDAATSVSTVRARIFGEDKRPLAGATLRSIEPDGRALDARDVAYSDDQGRVVLELGDASMRTWRGKEVFDMVFAVGAAEHATEFVIKRPLLHGDTDLGEIRLGPGGVLAGTVVDSKGRPVVGAVLYAGASVITEDPDTLRIRGPSVEVSRPRATSASDGSFELTGIPAELLDGRAATTRLWAHAPGCLWTTTEPFTLPPRGRVEVGPIVLEEAPPERRIEGVVLLPDGLTAAGARVDFLSAGAPHEGHVIADSHGRFTVVARDNAAMDLLARDTAGKFGRSTARSAEPSEFAELRLTQRRVLSVTVAYTDGEPIDDAHVRLVLADDPSSLEDGGRLAPGDDWSYTDDEGRVELEIPGGSFGVWARRMGSGSERLGPFDHSSAPEALTITLERGAEVTGRVLSYGMPVEGAKVAAMQRYDGFVAMTGGFPNRYRSGAPFVLTDANGRFVLPLKPEWSKVGVVARFDGLAAGEFTLDVSRGDSVHGLEVHLTEGGSIEGAVLPPPGMEAAGLYVAASRGDGSPLSTIVDSEGRYRFEGLTPGEWRVEGRLLEVRTEMLSISRHPDDLEFRSNVTVADRETREFDVDMRRLGDVEVQGRLRIDGAAPPSGWIVQAVPPRHARGPMEVQAVELDRDGGFVFSARPGRVDLRLVGPVPGGATVEMLREVQLEGPRFEWEGTLSTANTQESFEGSPEVARFVRGELDRGDRELTIVPVGEDGILRARVPVGTSSLQVRAENARSIDDWEAVRTVEVP